MLHTVRVARALPRLPTTTAAVAARLLRPCSARLQINNATSGLLNTHHIKIFRDTNHDEPRTPLYNLQHRMLTTTTATTAAEPHPHPEPQPHRHRHAPPQVPLLKSLGIGLAMGVFGGMVGLGGGVLAIPLLAAAGLSQHQAHGTSVLAITATGSRLA